ncbi:MAG: glycosyltransferase family 2 protein [Nanoarchaeota archaeon]
MKTVIAILGRNAEKTLEKTYLEIPKNYRKNVFLSDDNSTDSTLEIAKKLKLKVYKNPRKGGYGSNAKNCFNSAIKEGADIIVILHSDNQYDATKIPAMVKLIEEEKADFSIGSRMIGARKGLNNMPLYRYLGNRGLTIFENLIMGTKVKDFHSGLMAIRTSVAKNIPYHLNYDDYTFHSEIVMQTYMAGGKFAEVGIPTRYEDENQSTNLFKTIAYGFKTLEILGRCVMHKLGIKRHPTLEIKR